MHEGNSGEPALFMGREECRMKKHGVETFARMVEKALASIFWMLFQLCSGQFYQFFFSEKLFQSYLICGKLIFSTVKTYKTSERKLKAGDP